MKKKLLIFTILFVLVTSVTVSGVTFLKKRHNGFYQRHFGIIDIVFRDNNFVDNVKEYLAQKAQKEKIWSEYFKRSLEKNSPEPLKLETYEGSGQAVHPDILFSNEGIHGYKYWLAFTPYPHSKEKYENPHILVSNDGMQYKKFPGLKNPIVPPPTDVEMGGHLSDTDIVFEDSKVEIYYVYNKKGVRGPSKFYKTVSADGINWSDPQLIYQPFETIEGYSPAIIQEDNKTKMWYLGGEGNFVFTQSSDNEKSWDKIQKCQIEMGKWAPWHVDIIKTDKGYEGLMCARSRELNTRALFYIYSNDGIKWIVDEKPLVFPRNKGWDNGEIYRATFLKVDGKYKIWYSARNKSNKWGIGYFEVEDSEMQSFIK